MERNDNTSISSGVTDTNALSQRCNQVAFDSGATYHSTNQNRHPGIQRAGVGSTDHGEYRPRCINVRHAAGHSPDAITCGATRNPTEMVYCSYMQIKKNDKTIHCVIYDYVQHQKWLGYRKRAHRRNAYTRAAIRRLTHAISLFNR